MIHFLGQSAGVPFSRTFFNAVLSEILEQAGKERAHRLRIFLSDGTSLDVCHIEELSDDYMVLRTFQPDREACDLGLEVIPYGLIYRLQLTPQGADDKRVGFSWKPPMVRPRPTKKIAK